MFLQKCDLTVENQLILYTNCITCSLGPIKLTSSSLSHRDYFSTIIADSDIPYALAPSENNKKAYSTLIKNDAYRDYKYVSIFDTNNYLNNNFVFREDLAGNKMVNVYESIGNKNEHIWGKYPYLVYDEEQIYKKGVLTKVDFKGANGKPSYAIDKYFGKYLQTQFDFYDKCTPFSSFDYSVKGSYFGYKMWLAEEIKKKTFNSLKSITLCNLGDKAIAFLDSKALLSTDGSNDQEFINSMCLSSGGKLSLTQDIFEKACGNGANFSLGNELYAVNCDNYKETLFQNSTTIFINSDFDHSM